MPEKNETFIRTTLVHGDKKADLLLPANLPVAELMPGIARRFVTMTPRLVSRGFVLTSPSGSTVDQGRTLRDQGVDDGAVLLLSSRVKKTEKKYDDLIEAVADVVNDTNRPWTEKDAAGIATGAAVTLLIATALLMTQARASGGIVVPISLGVLALLLTAVTWVLERGERHEHAAAIGLTSSIMLAACGWTIPSGSDVDLSLALAGVGGAVGAMIIMPFLTQWRELMIAPGVAGFSLGAVGASSMLLEGNGDRVAVVATAILGLFLLALPGLSVRLSRLEDSDPLLTPGMDTPGKKKTRKIEPATVKDRYIRGRRSLFAGRCGAGFALAVLTPWTVATGPWGVVVIGGILVILTLGTRAHYARMDVLSEYIVAVSIFAIACLSIMMTRPSWWLGLVIVLALIAAALIAFGLVIGSIPPWARSIAGMAETIAGIILIPAAVLALRLW